MKLRGGELGVEMKAGNEPVTVADKRASELIVSGLHGRFPGPTVISEELALPEEKLASLVKGRMWLVDPIDGTKDFMRGDEGFSVMIGLADAGRPVLGVVHQPAVGKTGRTFFATHDGGAHVLVDDTLQPLAVSNVTSAASVRLVASASHRSAEIDHVKQTLGITDEMNVGSVGVKLSLIALGVRDLYISPATKTKIWDTCAPEAILTAAGGRLSDLFGTSIDYAELRHSRGLVASNGHVHDEVVGKLAPMFESLRAKRP
jgi:3'(2'), 5'-bisphosphate nucleotidase